MANMWLRIALFYFMAISTSFTMRFLLPEWYENISMPFGFSVFKSWMQGLGPFLGAILVTALFKVPRKITFFGNNRMKSMAMAIIPLIVLASIGVQNNLSLNSHYYGLVLGFWIIIYGILEETGWRGYLQDELREYKPLIKYLIIGTMWYAWHFTFLRSNINVANEIILLAMLVAAAWGIGQIAEKTKSILVSGCFHTIGNIMGLSAAFMQNLNGNQKLLIVGLCLLIWIPVLIRWDKKTVI